MYKRQLYIYTAIAPVPLSAFAGEPSQSVGKSFIKSYACLLYTSEIWDVRGRLDHPSDYAENPEKTANPKYTEADLQAMVDVMEYATDVYKRQCYDSVGYLKKAGIL